MQVQIIASSICPRKYPVKSSVPRRNRRPSSTRKTNLPDHSLAEVTYHRLLEEIFAGRYPPHSILSEVRLAEALGVSRTPVHDALRQLAKDGLVVLQRNRRARVAGINRDDIFEIFELRKMLEGPACELAARRMDQRQLTPLRQFANRLLSKPKAAEWIHLWAEFDDAFHRTIAEASGNRRLAEDINRYRLLHKGFNRLATDRESLQQALAEHVAILDALTARDAARARELMVAHIAYWQDYFISHVPTESSQGPTQQHL